MKIQDVTVDAVVVPLKKKFSAATYQVVERKTLVVTVRLTDGTTATCHSGNGHENVAAVAQAVRDMAPLVIGRSIFDGESNWRRLMAVASPVFSPVTARHLTHAVATLDTALWHTLGVHTGQPLCRLLGSEPEPIPAMFTGGYYGHLPVRESVEHAVRFVKEQSLAALKLKVGGRPLDEDLRKLDYVRQLAGHDIEIVCDANRAWDVATATAFIDHARDHDLQWLEEPVHWHSEIEGMVRLRALGRMPIGAGQSEISPHGAIRLVQSGAIDVLNFDATWGGGITGWLKVAGYAELAGIRLAHHSEPQLSMHLLAGRPNVGYVEVYDADRDPVWYEMTDAPRAEDGRITAPDRPGLGIEVDPDFVRRFRLPMTT